jgi:hypothetical protein
MVRVASLAFVLRAGVKSSLTDSSKYSHFRTVQAKIDTILYQRLKLAEKDLMAKLQKLIFRSAGCLTREQVYPVGLVLWQLLRLLCLSSSHLSNIAQRFSSKCESFIYFLSTVPFANISNSCCTSRVPNLRSKACPINTSRTIPLQQPAPPGRQ